MANRLSSCGGSHPKRVPGKLGRHELDLIAVCYFQQLGHDSQHRLFKFFAWEVAKPKSPNGSYTDYPKLASAKLDKMTTSEIGKFLVVAALSIELYCPTYCGASLSKNSKLATEAAHYKVNPNRVLHHVKEQFKKKPLRVSKNPNLQTGAKSAGKRKTK